MNTKPTTAAALKIAILALAASHANLQALVSIRNDADGVVAFNALADYQKVVSTDITDDDILNAMGAVSGGRVLQKIKTTAATYLGQPAATSEYWFSVAAVARKLGLVEGTPESSVDMGAGWVRETVAKLATEAVLDGVEADALLSLAVVADPVTDGEYEAALNLA